MAVSWEGVSQYNLGALTRVMPARHRLDKQGRLSDVSRLHGLLLTHGVQP